MIYILTALYVEAKPFIQHFQLKKEKQNRQFEEFSNEEEGIRLVISGVGAIPAAVAMGCLATRYEIQEEDFLINIGISAASHDVGEVFLCHKITDQSTGRTFYPDILYQHPFREGSVVTVGKTVTSGLPELSQENAPLLYDMEAAALYQAGAYFFPPHRMSFLKVVSDMGEGETVTGEQVETLMKKSTAPIFSYVEQLRDIALDEKKHGMEIPAHLMKEISRVCEDLHCSKTMETSLWQHCRYLMLTGVDMEGEIARWYEEGKLPCRDRREGKKRFEELKAALL